jgi:hypothetical protein
MKYNFITKNGEIIETDSIKILFEGLGIKNMSWERLNRIHSVERFTKEQADFLKKYGLSPSTWNVACLQQIGMVYLYSADLARIKQMQVKNA